ncbi:MAG: MFS transporter, partial [Catenulispora sp.]|nr:MFS transporter [Catenulispora sp.]
ASPPGTSPQSPPHLPASLWRHRDFVLYWVGQTVDQFGSQVSWLAVPLLAISLLHASSFQVAALSAASSLPVLLVGLPAGAVADRVRRRPLMIVCALGCAAAMGSIPLADGVGHLTLAQLYAVVFVVGALAVAFDAAAGAVPPLLVDNDRLVDANGKLNVARGLAELAGPSAGGVLVGVVGAARAVTVDAFSYVFSAATLALMRLREPRRMEAGDRSSGRETDSGRRFRDEIADGVRIVVRQPLLRTIAVAGGVTTFLLAGVSSLWLLYVIKTLHWSVRAAGLVYGLSLIGGVAGGVVARRVIERAGVGRAVIGGSLLSAPLEAVTPLAPSGPAGQWLVAAAFTVLTCAGMIAQTATTTVRQLACPLDLLGRVGATNRFLTQGLRFLGPLGAGALATWWGLRPALLLFATLTVLQAAIYALSPFRSLRTLADVRPGPDVACKNSDA